MRDTDEGPRDDRAEDVGVASLYCLSKLIVADEALSKSRLIEKSRIANALCASRAAVGKTYRLVRQNVSTVVRLGYS